MITSLNKGFTLIEIIISSLILAISITGLLSAIQSLNRPAAESFEEIQAAYLGQRLIENLKLSIDAKLWDEQNSLLKAGGSFQGPVTTRDGITYNTFYTVTDDPGQGGRWVNVTIEWE
ncbi:MAG: prepilin-type N-terminal cleavage/methylation domain-containing protein [Candidatus Omnitrophota bacterium]